MREGPRRRLITVFVSCGLLLGVLVFVAEKRRNGAQQVRPRRATVPGVKLVEVRAAEDFQAALDRAHCGDTIVLQAGATWDAPGVFAPFIIPNKGCGAGNPITVQSSAAGLLPSGRVSPANAGSMARIRARGAAGAFQFAPGASYWNLDGLEITNTGADSANEIVGDLLDASDASVSNLTVQRCYIHPKETGTDYTRSALRALIFQGSGLVFKWNYAAGFFGRMAAGDTGINTNEIILCITCNNLNVVDNFLQAQYVSVFTGGGGESPQYTATLTNASTTQADFSNTTGLNAGRYIRFEVQGAGTINSANVLTRTGGAVLTSNEAKHTIWLTPVGGGQVYRAKVLSVAGNDVSLEVYGPGVAPNGNYSFTVFETASVDSVSGSTVRYTPIGINYLTQAPSVPGAAAWRVDQVVHDITMTKNTINIDYDSAVFEHNNSNNSPKGWVEFKAGDGILLEGNTFTGYPSILALTQHSNEGFTPWTKLKNVTIRSNFFNSVRDGSGNARAAIGPAFTDPYNTDEPGCCLTITNNLILSARVFTTSEGVTTATITHNTVINDQPSKVDVGSIVIGYTASSGWVLKDNIFANNEYGMNCQIGGLSACWPSLTILKNVIVDNYNHGDLASRYGSSILKPIRTAFSQVGFVDMSTDNYRLASSSPFRRAASDGTDPGVDMDILMAALRNSGTINKK